MEFLGVGPLELFFILILALIFLGPRDMVKTGRMLGKFLRRIVMSPTWRMVQQTSRELRTLPNRMIREAGMEEDVKDLDQLRKDVENQIGGLRKPFNAAASEVNENLEATQSSLEASSKTVAQAGLGAWTTPPTTTEQNAKSITGPSLEPAGETQAEKEPSATDTDAEADKAAAETPNPSDT